MVKLEIELKFDVDKYNVDISHPLDISIPLQFGGPQPSFFHAPPATSQTYEDAHFVGSVARGGSCNCEMHTLIPHTSGTHTECVGHITDSIISVHNTLRDSLVPATLVTLEPQESRDSGETYSSPLGPKDLLLTRSSLQVALKKADVRFLQALIVRSLPNGEDKRVRDYAKDEAPFLSTEAMTFLTELGIRHLLVDLPSVDRASDEGRLSNHRIFWNVPAGSRHVEPQNISPKTITELIYVPDSIPDGRYLLNIQLAPFVADAAPSRPILYKVHAL